MPWKNVLPMEEKQRFVNLMESGHFTVSELCEEYGVSRKTGHKWLARYAEAGRAGLEDRSRAPKTVNGRTDAEIERCIVNLRRAHMMWGPKKIQRVLVTKHGVERPPAVSTVGEVLKRHGMNEARRKRPGKAKRGKSYKIESSPPASD